MEETELLLQPTVGPAELTEEPDRPGGVGNEPQPARDEAEWRRDLALDWGMGICFVWSGLLFLATPVIEAIFGVALRGPTNDEGPVDWPTPILLGLLLIPTVSFLAALVAGFWTNRQLVRMASKSTWLTRVHAGILGVGSGVAAGVMAGLVFYGVFGGGVWIAGFFIGP